MNLLAGHDEGRFPFRLNYRLNCMEVGTLSDPYDKNSVSCCFVCSFLVPPFLSLLFWRECRL